MSCWLAYMQKDCSDNERQLSVKLEKVLSSWDHFSGCGAVGGVGTWG